MSTTEESTDAAEDLFDAIADAAAAAQQPQTVTEGDRIADERFVVAAFDDAASKHTWEDTRGKHVLCEWFDSEKSTYLFISVQTIENDN